jgi:hypothetical protein
MLQKLCTFQRLFVLPLCSSILEAISTVADRKKELTWEFSFVAGNEEEFQL